MSCIDDGFQEFVVSPLKEARKDIDWILKQAQRGSLDPKNMQKALRKVGEKLRVADGYFEGLLT